MIILIAYATVEGHTATIASHIGEQVEAAGHQAILADLSQPGFGLPARIDGAILCAPIHVGRYPQLHDQVPAGLEIGNLRRAQRAGDGLARHSKPERGRARGGDGLSRTN